MKKLKIIPINFPRACLAADQRRKSMTLGSQKIHKHFELALHSKRVKEKQVLKLQEKN
jgi:hypothetical protein